MVEWTVDVTANSVGDDTHESGVVRSTSVLLGDDVDFEILNTPGVENVLFAKMETELGRATIGLGSVENVEETVEELQGLLKEMDD